MPSSFHLWNDLEEIIGVKVSNEDQRKFELQKYQERYFITPRRVSNKTRVLEYGTTVSATFIARKMGLTVRRVQQIRKLTG